MSPIETSEKVIVVGLDGATFDLLLPWIEEGILPAMAKIMKEGVWGTLESTIPPLTPPAWASFITGTNPGKHGIYDFWEPRGEDFQRSLVSSHSIQSTKIWKIINAHQRKVGIINIPLTYPPDEVDGFMVSGMLTPDLEHTFTYPPALKERIISEVGNYIIDVDSGLYDIEKASEVTRFFHDLKDALTWRKKIFFFLIENEAWDFLAVNFIVHDRIQHLFWKYLDKNSPLYYLDYAKHIRSMAIELYQMADEVINSILGKIDKKTTLYIISDHGFGPHYYSFNVNGWLAHLGLLKIQERASRIRAWIKPFIPTGIRKRLGKMLTRPVPLRERREGADIDYKNSKAYFSGSTSQGIYLRAQGNEYKEIRQLIKDELLKMKDPRTGEKLMDEVFFKEEIYHGKNLASAPDLLFIAKGYSVPGSSSIDREHLFTSYENSPRGFHQRNGIFMAMNENFKKGYQVKNAAIIDLAPTILYTMGIPIPSHMDGKALKEIFTETYVRNHPVFFTPGDEEVNNEANKVYSQEEQMAVEKRLKGLGYLD
jgi:predicted AlkP superfamily phosphohydrolase/phosphomutase